MKKITVYIVILFVSRSVIIGQELNSKELVNQINNLQNDWKADQNEITEKGIKHMKRICGINQSLIKQIPKKVQTKEIEIPNRLPKEFDARDHWPDCPSIASIRDQGDCGSCWAVSVASSVSDRICIQSGSQIKLNISAQNLLSCCFSCIQNGTTGCDGGDPEAAWSYFNNFGAVTGGDYHSNEGCQPYEVEPLADDTKSSSNNKDYMPVCRLGKCTNEFYDLTYDSDIYKGVSTYLVPPNEDAIKTEIMKNGSVVACLEVYLDFIYYKTGIYSKTSNVYVGAHAVRIIGWGTERGTKYWLAANSWNKFWGNGGYFKIKRGVNECLIESIVIAGHTGDSNTLLHSKTNKIKINLSLIIMLLFSTLVQSDLKNIL